jgi:thymidylate kinase
VAIPAKKRILLIEGPECAGKSTLFRWLRRNMRGENVDFVPELAKHVGKHFLLGTSGGFETELAFASLNGVLMDRLERSLSLGGRAISDRGWTSQVIYARVRRRTNREYEFDPQIFARQEVVLRKLYSRVVASSVIIFLDIPPEESMRRSEKRRGRRRAGHEPDEIWVRAAHEEYRRYINAVETRGEPTVRRIDGTGSIALVRRRFVAICRELGFSVGRTRGQSQNG